MMTNGKGDSRRPGDDDRFRQNYARIFGVDKVTRGDTARGTNASINPGRPVLAGYHDHADGGRD